MSKYKYSPYQTIDLQNWNKTLESYTNELSNNFEFIINGIKDRSILLDQNAPEICMIEFHHGVDTLDFILELTDENERLIKNSFGKKQLFPHLAVSDTPIIFDFEYPDDMDIRYEEYRQELLHEEKYIEFFLWFSKNWIKKGGNELGVLAVTIENSIDSVFNLNTINWRDNTERYYAKKGQKISFPINRSLTDFEIKQRVRFSKFNTEWRYLTSQIEFAEFGFFNGKVYSRRGNHDEFWNCKFAEHSQNYLDVANQIDTLINNGFEEVPCPHEHPQIMPNIFQIDYNCRSTPKTTKSEIHQLEHDLEIKIPEHYSYFITNIYDQLFLRNNADFPISLNKWYKIDRYLNPQEVLASYKSLMSSNEKLRNEFPFAITESGHLILMNCINTSVYLYSIDRLQLVNSTFIGFLNSSIHLDSDFCPKCYHIELGNISMVKKWVKEGWTVNNGTLKNSEKIFQKSPTEEMNILLLENGANPNTNFVYIYNMSRNLLDKLLEFGLNLEEKFEQSKWLRKNLEEKGGFEDILKRYPKIN